MSLFVNNSMTPHHYLTYLETDQKIIQRILTVDILNYYYTEAPINSSNRWKDKGAFTRKYKFTNGQEIITSKPIEFSIVNNELASTNSFDPLKFDLFPLECIWLDNSLTITKSINAGNDPFIQIGTEHIYGTKNPVTIRLDTNGIAATSFMNHLFRYVIEQRRVLISNSDELLSLHWHLKLRNLICDAVSLVDMTLNRLHYEAENNPKHWWKVSAGIGSRNGVRLLDKIQWVHKCTGATLPNITEEKAALTRLKELRNQLMHFEPPYFILLFENLAIYLNDIIKLGCFIYKIRKTIGVEISQCLVEFMLQKEVKFIEKKEVKIGISI